MDREEGVKESERREGGRRNRERDYIWIGKRERRGSKRRERGRRKSERDDKDSKEGE